MTTSFSPDVRVCLCASCGAPLQISEFSSQATCTYCSVVNVIDERDDRPIFEKAPHPDRPEEERLRMLRSQTDRGRSIPPSIAELMDGPRLSSWRVDEAMATWQALRSQARENADPDLAERLLRLSELLAEHLTETNDAARARALLESALGVVTFARHRQVLRCRLAILAACAGDVAGAQRWIVPCDPVAEDLESDSAYRVAYATIATVNGDIQGVFTAVGAARAEPPFLESWSADAVVLRANAYEQSGQVERAAFELMSAGGAPWDTERVDRLVARYEPLGWCRSSFARAQEVRQGQRELVSTAVHSDFASGCYVILGLVCVPAFIVALILVLIQVPNKASERRAVEAAGGLSNNKIFTVGVVVLALSALGMVLVAVRIIRRRRRANRIRRSGIAADAVLLAYGGILAKGEVDATSDPNMVVPGSDEALELASQTVASYHHELAIFSEEHGLRRAKCVSSQLRPVRFEVHIDRSDPSNIIL